ncbi:MAG: hypothetical protein PVF27_08200, partial [Gemmatimonadales bacterium]
LRFGRKPLLFFGLTGGLLFLSGILAAIVAFVLRYGYGIGYRPLLSLVTVLVVTGIALFGVGFIGELLAGAREEVRGLQRSVDELIGELRRRRD